MIYVFVEKLILESKISNNTNIATICVIIGFL